MPTGETPSPRSPEREPCDDRALMGAISAGDAAALARLYDRHSPTIFAFCLRALGDRMDAEDLLIDIFWEVWAREDRYDPARSSPRTYLLNLTRSRIVDRLRTLRARRASASVRLEGENDAQAEGFTHEAAPAEPINDLVSAEQGAELRAAMERLTPAQREALEMAFFDAMSHSDVAQRLGQPIGTVKSRIRQALIRLREIMGATAP